jgi:uncharacterized membrane protein YhaH (DUF805 family)
MTPRRKPYVLFTALWWLTGAVLFILSAMTVSSARGSRHDIHALVVGAIEAVGAVLFLFPSSMRFGSALLLLALGVAFVAHTILGQFRADLLIYAAVVVFVAANGASGASAANAGDAQVSGPPSVP